MQVIDNKREKVGDVLTQHITRETELSVITSLFSIYAFAMLENNLPLINKLRLLFSAPLDLSDKLTFIGDADERKLRNQLTQQFIATQCREWLAEHAEILLNTSVSQNLMFTDDIAIQGGADLTASGLGFVNSGRFSMNTAFDEKETIESMAAWFESVWGDRQKIQDIKKSFLDQLAWIGRDKAPDLIYYLILYHIFTDTIGELDEEKIIKTKTGIKEHLIWQKLYKFQKDGVLGAIQKLEKYNGCIIADSVGLGKTFEALAIIKYYELRNDKVLVICPKRLRDNWTLYKQNDERNIFGDDGFRYDVLNHSDLSRTQGMSGDINLATLNWKNYDLVVIDESHNFTAADCRPAWRSDCRADEQTAMFRSHQQLEGSMRIDKLREMPHWSYSAMQCYLTCPLKYKFRYIDNAEPERTGSCFPFGRAFHAALSERARIGKDMSEREVCDVFEDYFKAETDAAENLVYKANEDYDSLLQTGFKMVEVACKYWQDDFAVQRVAETFSVNVPGLSKPLIGEFDCVVTDGHDNCIVDWKTASAKWPVGKADKDLQATAFSYAFKQKYGEKPLFRFDVFTKAKSPTVNNHYTLRTDNELERFVSLANQIEKSVNSGNFYPNESGFGCGECPYRDRCKKWR